MKRIFEYQGKTYKFICFFGYGNRVFGRGHERILVDIDGQVVSAFKISNSYFVQEATNV